MTRGRRPAPPKIRLLKGIGGGRDSGGRLVLPGLVLPPATPPEPAWDEWFPGSSAELVELRETASAEWRRAAAVLTTLGLLTALDGAVLALYAVSFARMVECEQRIAGDGLVVDGRRHPLAATLADYRRDWRRWAEELGLAPAARRRLAPGHPADDDPDGLYDA